MHSRIMGVSAWSVQTPGGRLEVVAGTSHFDNPKKFPEKTMQDSRASGNYLYSYDEIARHLGVSHGAVESRLHRARQRLREELAVLEVAEVRK